MGFREDYIMRNTDRGLDNFVRHPSFSHTNPNLARIAIQMIKYCPGTNEKTVVDTAPSRSAIPQVPTMSHSRSAFTSTSVASTSSQTQTQTPSECLSRQTQSQTHAPSYLRTPHLHIAAIDNSLSFPHQHPKGWRSYTYGWSVYFRSHTSRAC
jgi:phosphatidylinositol 4-kinase type 2